MATANSVTESRRRLQISTAMTVGRASLLMALMVALSRITGFGRMMVTSHLYGRNAVTDAYSAAFNIPDTISILIAGGALATGFVPVFTEYLAQGREDAARRTFRAMLTLLGVALGVLSLGLFVLTFTPWGRVLAAKQVPDASVVDLYLRLLRVLLVAQFFFVLGGMFTGTFNALRLFWYPALQPVVFNLGIIIFGIAGPKLFGMGIESQAWGALAGAVIGSILIQVPVVWRNGLSLRPLWDLQDAGVRRVLKSLLPIIFGLASGQIIALNLPRFFGGSLPDLGDLSALDYANRLMQLPLAILASGPAIALFPTLSLLSAQGKIGELRTQIAAALRRTLLLTLLGTALLMALRVPVIQLLLERGKFTHEDTIFTAQVLFCYSFGILGLAAQQLLARGFYAMQDTRTPIIIGVVAMAVFCALGALLTFVWPQGAPGLAVAASVATTILGGWLWLGLRTKLGGWDGGATTSVLLKGSVASVMAYASAYGIQYFVSQWLHGNGLIKYSILIGGLLLATLAGVAAFIAVASALRVPELDAVTRRFMRGRK